MKRFHFLFISFTQALKWFYTNTTAMCSPSDVVSHPLNMSTWKRLVSVCSENSHGLAVCDSHILTASVRNSRMIQKSPSWRRAARVELLFVMLGCRRVQARPWRMYTALSLCFCANWSIYVWRCRQYIEEFPVVLRNCDVFISNIALLFAVWHLILEQYSDLIVRHKKWM